MNRRILLVAFLALAAVLGLSAVDESRSAFVDVTLKSGLSAFRNVQGGDRHSKPHILEVMGGGAAFLDYNNDGNLDILLVRGSTIANYRKLGGDTVCTLYRGNGQGAFTDVTKSSRLDAARGWGMGGAVADVDNDGWQDILITGYGRNFLFRNRQDGSFDEIAVRAGIAGATGAWGMGAAFADLDRDGDLDVYIANYLDYPLANLPARNSACNYLGYPVFCGPRGLPRQRDALYFGDGKGMFRDVTIEAGIDPDMRYSLQPLIADFDNDGWPDIFVATDLTGNYLYRNLGGGKFEDIGVLAGAAYSQDGIEQGSMGADFGDLDNDGWLDLYYTNSSFQTNELLLNSRDGTFANITSTSGHGTVTYLYVGWGTSFADLDNDGWEDVFVTNGHLYPEADKFRMGLTYRQRSLVFLNTRDKRFREVAADLALPQLLKGRGLAIGDYDNDGRLDVLINNLDDRPLLLRNEIQPAGNWLLVRCIGRSNRTAVGARLKLHAGSTVQMREIKAGVSYLSSNDLRVHFGLGTAAKAEMLEIRWPGGTVDLVRDIRAGQFITIKEGQTNSSAIADMSRHVAEPRL